MRFLCFFLLLAASGAFAQKDVKGYVVTYNQDTIQGQFAFKDWDVSPAEVRFRAESAADYQTFTVKDIHAFGIPAENQVYVARQATKLKVAPDIVYETAPHELESVHVFMQVLLRGPAAAVYRLGGRDKQSLFYVEKNGEMLELINQPYLLEQRGNVYRSNNDLYKTQLSSLCSDTDAFQADRVPTYDEKALIRYFSRYNACFLGETVIYQAPVPKVKLDVGIIGGVQPGILSSGGDKRVTGAVYGVSARVSLPRRHYNRFVQLSFAQTPKAGYDGRTLTTLELTVGTYFGAGSWRPFVSGGSAIYVKHAVLTTVGVGLSYKRRAELEIGQALRFIKTSLFNKEEIFPPRIALRVYLPTSK